MLQELLELVREQSRANLERRINTDQKDRAEIIIKILKEGIYGTSDDIIGSPTYSANYYESSRSPFDKLHNMITRDRLEKELLDMALRVQ
jgi:hypothetical protein